MEKHPYIFKRGLVEINPGFVFFKSGLVKTSPNYDGLEMISGNDS